MRITFEEISKEKYVCCICNKEFYGYGNNPYPVKEDGRCCSECNMKYVIPARMEEYLNDKNK